MKTSQWMMIPMAVLALAIVVFGIGFLLPDRFRVERSAVLKAPPARVWAEVSDLGRWRSWNPWQGQDPAMKMSYSPQTHGVGAWQQWQSERMGNGRLEITRADSTGGVLAYTMQFDDWSPSTGEISLAPEGSATRVTWVMAGPAESPMSRWFGLLSDRMVGPDFEQGLLNLQRLVEQQSR